MQIWAETGKSALPIHNYSQILYQFLMFTQNLKRSQKYTDRIALVFLDFYMPGKSGLDVLSFMQTDNYNIPVIMVTGEPDNELEKQAFALGAADIIYKPFDPDVVYGFASKYIQ